MSSSLLIYVHLYSFRSIAFPRTERSYADPPFLPASATSATTTSGGVFGAPAAPVQSMGGGGMFGSVAPPTTTTTAGGGGGGLFGSSTPAPASSTGGLFGATPGKLVRSFRCFVALSREVKSQSLTRIPFSSSSLTHYSWGWPLRLVWYVTTEKSWMIKFLSNM
jgi:hypothetical protein